jgi:hypothetical protein
MNYPLYNERLAPIWDMNEDGPRLDSEIRKQLIKIAMDFAKEIKDNNEIPFKVEDIVIIGSITNYNWTPYSDIDLHISTDYSKLGMDKEKAQVMFDAIKAGWNNKHNIKMKGFDVELYVEDINAEQVTASKYSVLRNEWIREPKKQSPNFNKELIKKKYNEYKKEIDSLIKQRDETKLKKLLEKIYNYRQAGLDKSGELSEENIVFRILRAKGHLDRLKDDISKIYDKKVSVKEIAINKNEYQMAIEDAADLIYDYGRKYKKYPDINDLLDYFSKKFKKDKEVVYMDLARRMHDLISK